MPEPISSTLVTAFAVGAMQEVGRRALNSPPFEKGGF